MCGRNLEKKSVIFFLNENLKMILKKYKQLENKNGSINSTDTSRS